MKLIKHMGAVFGLCTLITGCGNEEPTVEYIPEASAAEGQVLEDNRLLEPVMLNYLNSIKGDKTVVGVHNREPNNDPDKWTEEVARTAGVWPGLWSGDFLFSQDDVANRRSMIFEAEKRWKQGMLVNIMMHVCPPTIAETCGWNTGGMHYELSTDQWASLLTDGGDLNKVWKERLDDMAFELDYLNKKGVRVLFRPFHEMNQTIFWWSSKNNEEKGNTPALYRLTHDYLVKDKDLTNLTFVWNMQDFATLAEDLETYDPGEAYWDVLSLDVYGTDGTLFSTAKYDAMAAKAGSKPFALGEVQVLPTSALLAEQPLWTFVMSWAELTYEHNSSAQIRSLYNADNVIKLDDMPGWTDGNKVTYEVPVSNVQVIEPFVIFEEELLDFHLLESNASIVETVVEDDAEHGMVIEHTYVGIETVSEFRNDANPIDLSKYAGGRIEFDLKVINEPDGIDGKWFMKVDCFWPCGSGDIPLTDSAEAVAPTVGEWQHYTFDIDALVASENDGPKLDLTNVNSPIVVYPNWGSNQKDAVFRIDNIIYYPSDELVIEEPSEKVIYADAITEWKLPSKSEALITEAVVDAEDSTYGKVIQHTYTGIEVVSEFSSESPQDFSAFAGGTLSFDLLVVEEPEGISGWFMKIDCGWPCGTGDVSLLESIEGIAPTVGEWQRYTFNIDDLAALDNNGTPLQLNSVGSPLVLFPSWGPNQKGTIFQVDNIVYAKASNDGGSDGSGEVADTIVFSEAIGEWKLPSKSIDKITEEVVDAADSTFGKVIQHTYTGVEVVSEFASESPQSFGDYVGGTVSFDLLVVTEPDGIDGQWFMKIDCGWPCGTGDVALSTSVEGVMPTVGEWQKYTFYVDDLIALDNGGNPLNINSVSSPLVLFPAWGSNQKGTVFQVDNIVYSQN